jgi:hypothetical protein
MALGQQSRKLSKIGRSSDRRPKIYYLEFHVSDGTLSRWSRLYSQSLAPTNPHTAHVVGYGPFSLWVIHKEGPCPSSGDISRLMMIMNVNTKKLYNVSKTNIQFKYGNSVFIVEKGKNLCISFLINRSACVSVHARTPDWLFKYLLRRELFFFHEICVLNIKCLHT